MSLVGYLCYPCHQRFFLFFFSSRRRHTRYIGDWSSDVCSSDLHPRTVDRRCVDVVADERRVLERPGQDDRRRSEERRVGKECRSRGARDDYKKKNNEKYEGGRKKANRRRDVRGREKDVR